MTDVLSTDLASSVSNVVGRLPGIENLYPVQIQLLDTLLKKDNIFFTSATNSGKTLPALIFPDILEELRDAGYNVKSGKVLFLTSLNSIKMSMVSSAQKLGIRCAAVTVENCRDVVSSGVKVLFISPEVLKVARVTSCLLSHRADFILKVVDEAHLGKFVQQNLNYA